MANGPYTLVIQGTGPFNNSSDPNSINYDADKLLKVLTDSLITQGHTIQVASFLAGQSNPVTVPSSLDV